MSSVKNLFKNYGEFTIQVKELNLLDQGVTALWGPSGSGKTSIVRILLGLEPCPGLTWDFNGKDLAQLKIQERQLGVVFQNYELFPHMTARENILFAAHARRRPSSEVEPHLKMLSQKLSMGSFLDRNYQALSGGQKQRVAMARALIGKPHMLFLDEPFTALDENLRVEARNLVRDVIRAESIPTLLISHDRADIEALANKIYVLDHGQIISEITPS